MKQRERSPLVINKKQRLRLEFHNVYPPRLSPRRNFGTKNLGGAPLRLYRMAVVVGVFSYVVPSFYIMTFSSTQDFTVPLQELRLTSLHYHPSITLSFLSLTFCPHEARLLHFLGSDGLSSTCAGV